MWTIALYLVVIFLTIFETGKCQLNFASLLENPMSAMTDPNLQQMLGGGGGGMGGLGGMHGMSGLGGMHGLGGGAHALSNGDGMFDPQTMAALMQSNTAPVMDANMMTQLASLMAHNVNDILPTTPAPTTTTTAAPVYKLVKPQSPGNLGSTTIGDILKVIQVASGGTSDPSKTIREIRPTANLNPNLPAAKLLELAKDGLGISPYLQNMLCPLKQCPFPLPCSAPVKTYSPETFFVCPECPKCPGDILKGVSAKLGKVVRIAAPRKTLNVEKKKNPV